MRGTLAHLVRTLLCWACILLIVFPLLWMLLTSFKPEDEVFSVPVKLLPEEWTIEYYRILIEETAFPTYFLNSLVVSTATTLLVVAVATIGAYSIVRFSYRGRAFIASGILLSYLLPSVVLIIPLYMMMVEIGLANSLASLVLAYASFALPFALWLLRSFMAAIPEDLESAAMIDGASRLEAFVDVVLPQALPGIISTMLFTFILAWNEYLFALVLVNADAVRPLTTGVMTMLVSGFNIEWSLLMAASVLMSLPLIVILAFLQSYLVRGFGAGAVKG